MRAWGLVVAAGTGTRLGGSDPSPKAFREVAGVPMLVRAVRALASLEGLLVVAPPGWEEQAVRLAAADAPGGFVAVATGRATRQESVRAGLAALPSEPDAVVVHDAARPLATAELVERALGALSDADGAVCAVPVADTVKRADGGTVLETIARTGLWRAQTPQAFRLKVLCEAHARAEEDGVEETDDAALVERIGGRVVMVSGDERNLKITTAADLVLAESLLAGEGAR